MSTGIRTWLRVWTLRREFKAFVAGIGCSGLFSCDVIKGGIYTQPTFLPILLNDDVGLSVL